MIYVFRCDDGCEGIAASVIKSKVEAIRSEHKKTHNHKGSISLEDKELVENEGLGSDVDRSPFLTNIDEEGNKKVRMQLVGMDGNAFAIMGRFHKAAVKAGWSKEEISAVLKEAESSDYNHFLATIMEHVDEEGSA
jgi:hypothetical protein